MSRSAETVGVSGRPDKLMSEAAIAAKLPGELRLIKNDQDSRGNVYGTRKLRSNNRYRLAIGNLADRTCSTFATRRGHLDRLGSDALGQPSILLYCCDDPATRSASVTEIGKICAIPAGRRLVHRLEHGCFIAALAGKCRSCSGTPCNFTFCRRSICFGTRDTFSLHAKATVALSA